MQAGEKVRVPHNYREAEDWIGDFIDTFNRMSASVENIYAACGKSFWKGNDVYRDRNSLVFNPKNPTKRRPLSSKEFYSLRSSLKESLTPAVIDKKTHKIKPRISIFYPEEIAKLELLFEKYATARKYLDARSNPNIIAISKGVDNCVETLETLLNEYKVSRESIRRLDGLVKFLDQSIQLPRSQARYQDAAKAAHVIGTVLRDRPTEIGLPSQEIAAARMNTLIRGARAAMQGRLKQFEDKQVAEMQELRSELPATVELRTLTHQGYIKGTRAPMIALAIADAGVDQEMYGYTTAGSGMLHNAACRIREIGCGMFESAQELGGRTPDQAWLEDLRQCETDCDPESAAFTSGGWAEELAWDGHFTMARKRIEYADALIKSSGLNLVIASQRLERARGLMLLAEFKISRRSDDLIAATDILRPLVAYYRAMGHSDTLDDIDVAFARAMGNPSP